MISFVIPDFVKLIDKEFQNDADLLIWKTKTCYGEIKAVEQSMETKCTSSRYYSHDSFGLGGTSNTIFTRKSI